MPQSLLLMLIGLSLLSGCGFKLRGSFEMSAALARISIEGGERELADRLTELLAKSGSTVVDGAVESPTLVLSKAEFTRDVRTTDADGIATGYSYTYLVEYSVSSAAGEALLPLSSFIQFRTAEYATGDELIIEEEEEFLKQEMEKEITVQIMRKLSRIQ